MAGHGTGCRLEQRQHCGHSWGWANIIFTWPSARIPEKQDGLKGHFRGILGDIYDLLGEHGSEYLIACSFVENSSVDMSQSRV